MKKYVLLCVFAAMYCLLAAQNQRSGTPLLKRVETDNTGKKTSIVSESDISDDLLRKIQTAVNAAWQIPGLVGTNASVLVDSAEDFRFVLHPTEFTYINSDFLPYVPAGISFYYKNTLFYDITLKVGSYAPKLLGTYVSPDDLLKNILSATIVPEQYLFDSYLLKRVERLEKALMAVSKKDLFSKPTTVSEQVILEIRNYFNENPSISKKEVAQRLRQDGIKASTSDINAVFMVLLGRIE